MSTSLDGRFARRLRQALALALVASFTGTGTAPAATPFTKVVSLESSYTGPQKTPDPNLAIGPLGALETTNAFVLYLTKAAGEPSYNVDLRGFFSDPTPPNSLLDVRCLYDQPSGRFFAICLETSLENNCPAGSNSAYHAYLHVAVSTNSNPRLLTNWIRYRFDVTEVVDVGGVITHYGPDYPGLGIDSQALYVTGNAFKLPVKPCGSYRNAEIIVLDKSALIAGTATPAIVQTPAGGIGSGFTLQPVSVIGPASPGNVAYFAEVTALDPNAIRLWALQDPLGTRQLTSVTLPVRYHGSTLDGLWAPQCQGSPNLLRTWNNTAQGEAFWRNGELWFAQTGDTLFRARIQYYRVQTNGYPAGSPVVTMNGVIEGSPGEWLFQPAIGGNPAGDVAIGFTLSSANTCPTFEVVTKAANEPDFSAPQVVATSALAHDNSLVGDGILKSWGDFGSVTYDPIDSSLWVSHEIAYRLAPDPGPKAGWAQPWGNFVFPSNPMGWPSTGRPLRRGASDASATSIVRDDAGGALVTWHEARGTTHYVARIGDSGALAPGWAIYGNPTRQFGGPGAMPRSVTDGSGGAYVVATAAPTGGLLSVVRMNTSGAAVWDSASVLSASAAQARAVPDGQGGVFVAWFGGGVRVQRLTPTGAVAAGWPTAGLLLSAAGDETELAPDGLGGVFVSNTEGTDIVVRHVTASGALDLSNGWSVTGVVLGEGSGGRLIADGSGGVILVGGVATASGLDLTAHRVLADGTIAGGWAGGVAAEAGPGDPVDYVLAGDGSGGVVLAWTEDRLNQRQTDLYATRLLAGGVRAPGWPASGLLVCGAPGDQWSPSIDADGTGGAVLAWADRRGQPTRHAPGAGDDIYWARVTGAGAFDGAGPQNGAPVCTAVGDQATPAICLASPASAIVAWADGRQTPAGFPSWTTEVYAQREAIDVTAPAAVPNLTALAWSCSQVLVAWTAPGDDGDQGTATSYNLRVSASPITAANFSAATPVPTITPGPAGSAEIDTLELGPCTQPRYFAIAALDEVGHVSGLSNVSVLTCLPCTGDVDPRNERLVDALLPPVPNPTHSLQRFDFTISRGSAGRLAELSVFDAAGRLVKRLRSGVAVAGRQSLVWDLRDPEGRRVANGAYFARLRVADRTFQRTVIVR